MPTGWALRRRRCATFDIRHATWAIRRRSRRYPPSSDFSGRSFVVVLTGAHSTDRPGSRQRTDSRIDLDPQAGTRHRPTQDVDQVERRLGRRFGDVGQPVRRTIRRRDGGVLPAGPDLVPVERVVLPIEPAVPQSRCDRTAEVAAGAAARRRAVADPAARRLRLRCPTVRAAPRRHDQMVAATAAPVDAGPHPTS
jgi:hypothetical protein